MKKTLITAGASVLTLFAATMAIAQADPAAQVRKPMVDQKRTELVASLDARFAAMDANRDGSVSGDEMKAAHEARKAGRFALLDTDRNGALSPAEFNAQRGDRGGMRGHHRRGGGGHRGGGKAGIDANGDGAITKAEFQSRALARFDRADTDRNGVVTAAEHQQARPAHGARR